MFNLILTCFISHTDNYEHLCEECSKITDICPECASYLGLMPKNSIFFLLSFGFVIGVLFIILVIYLSKIFEEL